MMKKIVLSCLLTVSMAIAAWGAEAVSVTVRPDRVVNRVDEKVYGQFLEHIYHSCNGGLWGDMIWNRSFEQNTMGRWHVADGEVVQGGLGTDQRLTFGEAEWGDYELTFEAMKTGGSEGFLALFRVKSEKDFYWVNLGGWGNSYHQIERGLNNGNRWGAVGPRAEGRIETDKWYRIRIRCEGRRFQIFLDDRQIIDFTDDTRAHLNGKVGVGTWSTKARFRKIKVTSLDANKVLFEGTPATVAQQSIGKNWEVYGDGQGFIEDSEALNGQYSQRITSSKGETGLRQGALCVRSGETCVGSVWARGKASEKLVVRLVDGEKTLAEVKLGKPKKEWSEHKFSLTPNADASNATIEVGVVGEADVYIDQVSMMPKPWLDAGGFRPDLLKAVADIKPSIIRWPGGCFASSYRWKQGIGPQHERLAHPREIWDDLDTYSFGTDEYIAMCRKVGSEPLIVVNIGTEDWNGPGQQAEFLQEALDWIEYCNGPADSKWGKVRAANGHPEPYGVTYWEIDNETWHMGSKAYADAVNLFGPAMRKADPSIKLLACGSNGYDQNWNRDIINSAGKNFDYISTHHYESPDRYATGPIREEAFFRELAQVIATGPNPEVKVYCSEWNAQSTDWRTGIYCGGLLNVFERCGDFFEIGGPALFLRHVSATAWDNAFINFDQSGWFAAPNYVVMKLWRDHYAPNRIAVEGEAGALNVVATKSADGKTAYFKAVNASDNPIKTTVSISGAFTIKSASMLIVAPGPLSARNTLENPDRVHAESHPVEHQGQTISFEMPALSAGVVSIKFRP